METSNLTRESQINKVRASNLENGPKVDVLALVFVLLGQSAAEKMNTARTLSIGMQQNAEVMRDLAKRLESIPQTLVSPELAARIQTPNMSQEELAKINYELRQLETEMTMQSALRDNVQVTMAAKRQEQNVNSTQLNTLTQQLTQNLQSASSTSKLNVDLTKALLR